MSEESGPLGGLPAADRALLVNPPLELAIAEVRFAAPAAAVAEAASGLRLRRTMEAAGLRLTGMDQAQQSMVTIGVGPDGKPTNTVEAKNAGWQYRDPDRAAQVTVLESSVAVQTTKYERWSLSMLPLLAAALEAVDQHLHPQVVARIGLRYVDRFVDANATAVDAWVGRVHDALLGPVRHPVFGPRLAAAQQQFEVRLEEDCGAIVRHGPFVDQQEGGRMSYLLDIDTFDQRQEFFAVNDVLERAQVLNRTALSLFQACVTSEYLAELQVRQGEGALS